MDYLKIEDGVNNICYNFASDDWFSTDSRDKRTTRLLIKKSSTTISSDLSSASSSSSSSPSSTPRSSSQKSNERQSVSKSPLKPVSPTASNRKSKSSSRTGIHLILYN